MFVLICDKIWRKSFFFSSEVNKILSLFALELKQWTAMFSVVWQTKRENKETERQIRVKNKEDKINVWKSTTASVFHEQTSTILLLLLSHINQEAFIYFIWEKLWELEERLNRNKKKLWNKNFFFKEKLSDNLKEIFWGLICMSKGQTRFPVKKRLKRKYLTTISSHDLIVRIGTQSKSLKTYHWRRNLRFFYNLSWRFVSQHRKLSFLRFRRRLSSFFGAKKKNQW